MWCSYCLSIPWGGSQASELMLKLAQLKYPSFPVKVTQSQATVCLFLAFNSPQTDGILHQFMYRETCYFSTDYEEELRMLEDPAKLSAMTKVIQFPYSKTVGYLCC